MRTAAAVAIAALAGACAVSPTAGPSGVYARPIGDAPVIANPTPYSAALSCLADYARTRNLASPRLTVGRISDFTGKEEPEGGRRLTQGASLMAISALAKAGVRVVERYDTSVAELELRYANNKLITDAAEATPGTPAPYRRITSGSVPGSDFHIIGGITELNYNIRSTGADAFVGDRDATGLKGVAGARLYVMNIAVDLRLVDSQTLEVVDVVSYQKQIIGREISAGVFDFLNGNIFDVSVGEGGLEPVQLAVRSLIERGVVEFVARLYGAPGPQVCLDPRADVLAGAPGPTAQPVTRSEGSDAPSRDQPSRWHDRRDRALAAVDARGRY